jgi:hypothetical protein
MRLALLAVPALLAAPLALPAAAVPPPCPVQPPIWLSADSTTTYVHVRDPRGCTYVTVAVPVTIPPTATRFPCDPQPLLYTDSTGTYIEVRDPTQPCAYIRVRVPVDVHQ